MSQPQAELENLRAELEIARASAIEAHRKLREERRASDDNKAALKYAEEKLTTVQEDLRKALEMLDAQKVKFTKNQVALEVAKRSALSPKLLYRKLKRGWRRFRPTKR